MQTRERKKNEVRRIFNGNSIFIITHDITSLHRTNGTSIRQGALQHKTQYNEIFFPVRSHAFFVLRPNRNALNHHLCVDIPRTLCVYISRYYNNLMRDTDEPNTQKMPWKSVGEPFILTQINSNHLARRWNIPTIQVHEYDIEWILSAFFLGRMVKFAGQCLCFGLVI